MTRFDYESGCVKPLTNPISGQINSARLHSKSNAEWGDEFSSIRYFYVQYLLLTITITL